MYGGAILIDKIRCGTNFVENEKKEENISSLCNEKVMSPLYWFCKEEVAHCKLSSLLQFAEHFGVEEVATFNYYQYWIYQVKKTY